MDDPEDKHHHNIKEFERDSNDSEVVGYKPPGDQTDDSHHN